MRRRTDLLAEHRRIAILFSVFILGCGLTHILSIVVLWRPIYVIDGWVKALTALASIATASVLWPAARRLLDLPSPDQLATANALLQAEITARRAAMDELQATRLNLESEVSRRTAEVEALARRLELATNDSLITVTEQDDAMRFTWVHNARATPREQYYGRTDEEAFGRTIAEALTPAKVRAMTTGETVRTLAMLPLGEARQYYDLKITPVRSEGGKLMLLTVAIDVTDRERRKDHLEIVLRELAHRAKNLLSLVEGIVRQSAKSEDLPRGFVDRFAKRLNALGGAYDLLISRDWSGVDLVELVGAQVTEMLPASADRVTIDGPSLIVRPETGQYLALALHELLTNSLKYGAMRQDAGRLTITWRWVAQSDGPARVELIWREDGEPVAEASRSGFGSHLLKNILPRALSGEASLDFTPTGLCWRTLFAL